MERIVEELRRKFRSGLRVKLIKMDDIQAPAVGTLGTVQGVDDMGNILMIWDTGPSLSLIPDEDIFEIVE